MRGILIVIAIMICGCNELGAIDDPAPVAEDEVNYCLEEFLSCTDGIDMDECIFGCDGDCPCLKSCTKDIQALLSNCRGNLLYCEAQEG